jgi:hypothetical protein
MQTCGKTGFCQPKQLFSLSAQTTPAPISPIPSSYKSALKDPNWYNAMLFEFNALIENKPWVLVSRPSGANVVTGKWIYRHKFHPDGTLARYKARWVTWICPSGTHGLVYRVWPIKKVDKHKNSKIDLETKKEGSNPYSTRTLVKP